ncbi:serine O-acetyltransferase EpsC [Dokdonia sp. Hel_I_53]|uniref:serine O-acetyltransferase EpsC n=1 Tax=Dokdonia sp. Hel_I_53 TaxID=1566287 RepID=UPI00119B0E1B|nr:serine O-acetyltransferase EpsC [Dokdonia sp. Hel_I_53]TVZ51360.1 serine O-acetyltransferase [Dokdonia sp. Hel_I_53]
MNKKFIIENILAHKTQPNLNFELQERTVAFTERLFYTLFDVQTPVAENLDHLEVSFEKLVDLACWEIEKPCKKIWENYMTTFPSLLERLNLDAQAFLESDPAASCIEEIYMAYPGFYAISIYRFAHELHKIGFPLVPRMMTECAHSKTGVDIHPGAQIGDSFFIDHGTGVVIGEASIIMNNVRIYQGVTLGGLYVAKHLRKTKRHPTIESNVTIYANATILGGLTTIGANSIIGGNTFVTNSVPPNSKVYTSPDVTIKTASNVS